MHPRNHSLTHKFTHSHTQTGHFHGALQNNIHQWEEEIQKGLNWHRLLAERCWKSHFWGRKQLDTKKKRKTSYWPENNEMTDTTSSVLSVDMWTESSWRASVFLWLVTSGITAVHLMAFHMSVALTLFVIYTVQQRTTACTGGENRPIACQSQHKDFYFLVLCEGEHKRKHIREMAVPVSCL